MRQYLNVDWLLLFFCNQKQLSTVNLLKDTPCSRRLCLAKCFSFSECICAIGESGEWFGDVYLNMWSVSAFVGLGESDEQSCKNPVSASAMLTGKFLQIRKVFATSSLLAEEFSDTLQYKISRKYAKCPDELESFRTI